MLRLAISTALAAILLVGCSEDQGGQAPDAGVPSVQLTLVPAANAVTADAEAAVALAPAWLAADLRANLVRLQPDLQDSLARLLLDLEAPHARDEVAFCLAHISPEQLADLDFYPELVLDNVESLFAIDAEIGYADIVDFGDPDGDPDFYSTITYRTLDAEGPIKYRTLEPEIYYWYVVMPTIEDELPTYISPYNGQPTDPPTGRFWRDYLFYEADDGYEPLASYLAGQDLLWEGRRGNRDQNGAIGNIIQWVLDSLEFTSDYERPLQPVRIYAKHQGRCGEHADITSAAARAALIPNINLSAIANDHVWNEFYDERWIQWEPVNTMVEHYYYYTGGIGVDNDCDGEVDEDCGDLPTFPPETDQDGDGMARGDGDCNDKNAAVYLGAPELPDGRDNDCDGTADEGATLADADGDGVTIDAGDCNDWDATIGPGLDEAPGDAVDNDCDGVADDGLDETDADTDGETIAAGDCNDADGAINSGAVEIADGKDNDCDGVADEGVADVDGDGDGVSIADGDCDDRSNEVYPDAFEYTGGRNYAVYAWRPDGKTWTVTERYAAYFTLDLEVVDAAGDPVDGATVMIAGAESTTADIYIVTWAVTGRDGRVTFELGEERVYYYRVESALGNVPTATNSVSLLFAADDLPARGEQRDVEVAVDAAPVARDYQLVEGDSGELALEIEYDFGTGFTHGVNYLMLLGGKATSSREPADGEVDLFVVDEAGYQALAAGEQFAAIQALPGATAGTATVALPAGAGPWYAVFAAAAGFNGIAVGRATVKALAGGQALATADADLTLVSGDLAALRLDLTAP